MKTRTRARACTGKVRHPDRATALVARARLIAGGATRLTVYRCKHCAAWHVGHYGPR
ncbi:hypothetical protein RVR_5791 [Actinacidiphila reveromycinica]|uniref:Uncharacterized protein n=1 Tax=Actinacidiphila reveromycinica TaxID=659352 RepID=A0A7U3UV07_9ACTN|nr:hypothetical protein [Streptomyces sp. SN-593]BBA99251.1 hypothetical protein RVR_5791 [Streptomyces sp. SN-593]